MDDAEHWPNVPPAVTAVLRRSPGPAAEAWTPSPSGTLTHVPRALNVRQTPYGRMASLLERDGYLAQEKLDGVYVLWTGRRLLTKTGLELAAPHFTRWLPPGVALAGELYVGPNRLSDAVRLVQQLEHPDWASARLVAYDMPGDPVAAWPYAARHALLCHVVAAWSLHRAVAGDAGGRDLGRLDLLPLQVIRQHRMDRCADLFRAVVHGAPVAERRAQGLLPFGVPLTTVARRGLTLADPTRPWYGDDAGAHPRHPPWWEDGGAAAAGGEGLMLWRQDRPWSARGRTGRGTDSVLKYKPTVLTVARPYRPVTLASHTLAVHAERHPAAGVGGGLDADDDLPGYHVRLRWHDPLRGRETRVVAYVPASVDRAALDGLFPAERPVFVVFVAFGQKPLYARALTCGPRLPHWDAQEVHGHCLLEARARDPGRLLDLDAVPPLDRVAEAGAWQPGEMRALFPTDCVWSPYEMYRAAQVRRRFQPCPCVLDPLLATPRAAHAPKRARVRRPVADRALVEEQFRIWMRESPVRFARGRVPHLGWFLVGAQFVVALWAQRQLAGTAGSGRPRPGGPLWFSSGDDGAAAAGRRRGLPWVWGPFRVAEPEQPEDATEAWAACWLRLLLTFVASTWLRVGAVFAWDVVSPDADPREAAPWLEALLRDVTAHARQVVAVRFGDGPPQQQQQQQLPPRPERSVRALVLPRDRDVGLLPAPTAGEEPGGSGSGGGARLHLGVVARYAQSTLSDDGFAADRPPWAPFFAGTVPATRRLEFVWRPGQLRDMVYSRYDEQVHSVWTRVLQHELGALSEASRWTPRPDDVALDPATQVPLPSGPSVPDDVAPLPPTPSDPLRLAIDAVLRTLSPEAEG